MSCSLLLQADLQRQLAKANGEIQNWQSMYQSEGLVKAEEMEEAKRMLQKRLADLSEQA